MSINTDQRGVADRSALPPLGRTSFHGGNATLTICDGPDGSALFKEFADAFRDHLDADALTSLVAWRLGLSDEDRRELDTFAAWPRLVIRDGPVTAGLVIPVAPSTFLLDETTATAPTARTLASLVRPGVDTGTAVMPIPRVLGAVGLVVRAMLWLHRRDVVVNDVQPDNILISEDGGRVYLVDCDAMASPAWGSVAGPAAPEYLREVLADPDDQSPGTDFAKLAWCLIFLVLDDFSIRTLGDDELRRLRDFMPQSAVDLVLASRDPGNYQPNRVRDWQAVASIWIRAARHNLVLTDRGLRPWPSAPAPARSPHALPAGPSSAASPSRPSSAEVVGQWDEARLDGAEPTSPAALPRPERRHPGRSLLLAVVVLASVIAAVLLVSFVV